MDSLASRLQALRAAFEAQPYPNYQERKAHLYALRKQIQRYQDAITLAAAKDFGWRAPAETKLIDVLGPVLEINHALHSLKKWMKPSRRATELLFKTNSAQVIYQPKGVVAIICPWNFPLYLALGPLVAALAAGNRVMIKMPPNCPNSTQILTQMLSDVFASNHVNVLAGDHPEAMSIADHKFDHLIFTGSPASGRHIMAAAAKNLIPVTLELGGKSPAIICEDANLSDAAKRVAHGKIMNAGQVCLSPDYALVPRKQVNAFIAQVKNQFLAMHAHIDGSEDYTALVDERAEARFQDFLTEARQHQTEMVCCGEDGDGRQHPLYILANPDLNLKVMQEEIFGPILPVIPYDSIDEAIQFVNQRERPLALYLFGYDKKEHEKVLKNTLSGGVSINDWGWHAFNHDMPFGGIGNSGMGSYHGEEGFRALSHGRAVFKRHRFFPVGLFYPPYGTLVQKLSMKLFLGEPDTQLSLPFLKDAPHPSDAKKVKEEAPTTLKEQAPQSKQSEKEHA